MGVGALKHPTSFSVSLRESIHLWFRRSIIVGEITLASVPFFAVNEQIDHFQNRSRNSCCRLYSCFCLLLYNCPSDSWKLDTCTICLCVIKQTDPFVIPSINDCWRHHSCRLRPIIWSHWTIGHIYDILSASDCCCLQSLPFLNWAKWSF